MEIRVSPDPSADAAAWIARRLRDAVRRRGSASFAASGGSTAPQMFDALRSLDVPWPLVTIWQVDERVAPDGDPARNADQLGGLPARVKPMPVTASDIAAAAAHYGRGLPDRFDVVHLGLGDDGHTASWPPHHDVVNSSHPVEAIDEFNGYRRMTLTPSVVNRARCRVMLTYGLDKAPMLERWFRRDPELPASRLRTSGTIAFVDSDAASRLPL